MEWLILIALLLAAAGLVAYSFLPARREKIETVLRRTAGISPDDDKATLQTKARLRAAGPSILEKAAPIFSRPVMPKNAEEQSTLKAKLASAGYRRESAPVLFLASKTLGAALCALATFGYAFAADKETQEIMYFVIGGVGAGFLLPNMWLSQCIRKRIEAIRNGLPDSLDLMVVAVESGLGLDATILRVADEMGSVHPALAEELQIATIETQMGIKRAEALTKMADRTAVPEMRALIAVITQAEKLGTSVAKALRNQADSLRTKRRQKAEERAQKTAVKLLIPLILFIFPAIFVVLAGPAAIHLMNTFGGGGISK
ncbi:MAG TPA: type II secretion system F family protein [Phycisphaerae bacterium]|nr:type II secretion system F family protein [Phycisphaerae bacterium]